MSFERCPNCGWEEPSRLKKVSQHMNLYAYILSTDKDGKHSPGAVYSIINHHEDVVEIKPDIEGGIPFKVMKVDHKYTYKKPEPPKPLNQPVPTPVQKQTLITQ